jgi:signal transduction histidine kinase
MQKMTKYNQEYIEMEPFDREYGLQELLPFEILSTFFRDASALLPPDAIIFRIDGSVFFQKSAWKDDQAAIVASAIAEKQPEKADFVDTVNGRAVLVLPIVHELETQAYLALPCRNKDRNHLAAQGRSMLAFLDTLMNLNHKTMLTSGLHGIVVEESYGRLKEKAEQLALSEEKYRTLAANLEIEVEQKTNEIRKAHAHLMQQEKLAAIGQLSAGMAHEINNPLGFIISNLDTLKEYAVDLQCLVTAYQQFFQSSTEQKADGTIDKQCQAIKDLENRMDSEFLLSDLSKLADESMNGAQRIKKIISDLKIVARPGEIDPEPIDVQRSIDAVLTIVNNRIGPQLSVVKSYDRIPLVPGHPQEINQVWLNLILNALESMGDQGTLTITTQTRNKQVLVSISDTGQGIEKFQLPKIFDPFYTSKKVGSGIGLGLHLVYHVVQKHNGRIEVNSETGIGSTFAIHLPAGGSQ